MIHATKEAKNKHAVARMFFAETFFGETSTKVHSGVDAKNSIDDFNNEVVNVTELREFLQTNSSDEHTEMYGAIRDTC